MQKLHAILLLCAISLGFSTGCSVSVPDSEVCIELPSGSAYCKYTLSEPERRITKDMWDQMSVGRLSMTPEDFAKYQKFIEQACEHVKCSEEEKKAQKRALEYINNYKRQ